MNKIINYEHKMMPGKYRKVDDYAYIEYSGDTIPATLADKKDVTICVVSKNRKEQFNRLSNSIGDGYSKILITQGEEYNISGWNEYNISKTDILPAYYELSKYFTLNKEACNIRNSLSWARNEALSHVKSEWVACFDDDFVMTKNDWFDYYKSVQNHSKTPIVMNNFGAWIAHFPTLRKKIKCIDERYINGSSGSEDEDMFARWIEANLMMVIGFNKDHTFDSTWRGSSTGYNTFRHLRDTKNGCRSKDMIGFDNQKWHWTKWKRVSSDTGIQTRPPFKGWVKRSIHDEIDWIGDYR